MKIVLIGYRGVGKSSLGKALAKALQLPFIDTDLLIAEAAGSTISRLFSQVGESGFRLLEKQAIANLTTSDAVIACGGGSILDPDNARILKQNAHALWLTATTDTLLQRLAGDACRPPLTSLPLKEEIEKKLAQRAPLYARYADYRLATDAKTPHELLKEMIAHLETEMLLCE